MSLYRRVATALASLVAIFVIVQGTLAYLSLEEQEDRLADELVVAEARQLAIYAESGELGGPRTADLLSRGTDLSAWLLTPEGSATPDTLPDTLRHLTDGPHRPQDTSRHLHVMVMPTRAGRLIVQYDARRAEAQVHQYGLYLAGLGALCIGLGVLLARRLARIVVAPLERLTARLSDWAPDGRAEGTGSSTEETRLLEAFGRVQSRFERAIAREREFTANLGHELRNPLAALRTDLEMLDADLGLTPGQHQRLQRMVAAADAIAGAIEAARALTRHRPIGSEQVDLARCVDDAWLTLEPAAQQRGLNFENHIAPGRTILADRHALLTILRNLLRNAAEHAAPARCIVRGDQNGLEVADDGPGIDPGELPFVFERYWRGRLADSPDVPASERGLGLAIAREVADLNGWQLTAAPGAERGTRFLLGFHPD